MALRETSMGRGLYRLLDRFVMPTVSRSFRSPNQITWLSAGLALSCVPAFYLAPFAGFFLMGLSALADIVDGLYARRFDKQTPYGAFLDSTLDRASDVFFLMGFWVLFRTDAFASAATLLLFLAAAATVLISYTKARAEGLSVACDRGLFERGTRTVYLLIWALAVSFLPDYARVLLWTGLFVYLFLTTLTVLDRMRLVRDELSKKLDQG
ncbi:MAG: CDP-alcohol phosphatidyltransferase family protein [Thermodesulfobacteriota bacterium]